MRKKSQKNRRLFKAGKVSCQCSTTRFRSAARIVNRIQRSRILKLKTNLF